MPAGQIGIEVPKMFLEILQGFPLRHVIRIVLKVTKPEFAILPVDVP